MSVGGMVVGVAIESDKVWINTREILRWKTPEGQFPPQLGDSCAIYVERDENSLSVAVEDTVWWQGRVAYWTPRDDSGRVEVNLRRQGYSHAPPKIRAVGRG